MNNVKVKYSFAEWCRDNGKIQWLNLWDYELNGVEPEGVNHKSGRKYYFRCPRGLHTSTPIQLCNICSRISDEFCKECSSLGQWMLDNLGDDSIDKYWSDKNAVGSFDVGRGVSSTKMWFKCDDGSHPDYKKTPFDFVQGSRCPICSRCSVATGINDVATTHPDLVKYFKDSLDATKYAIYSKQHVWFECPYCGYEKYNSVASGVGHGFSCPRCGDGRSFPNKFITSLLVQLQTKRSFDFKPEKIFDWSKNLFNTKSYRQYDFYITYCDKDIIIEAHGRQHFDKAILCGHSLRTLEEEKENDKFKYELAMSNNINKDNYIVIDCRHSTKEWIKDSVMNSNLPLLFKFTSDDIDWNECERFALSSLFHKCCNMWEDGMAIKEIYQHLQLSESTVCKYLRKADELGIIEYNSRIRKPVMSLDNNLVFASAAVCENISDSIFGRHVRAGVIHMVANGTVNHIYGLRFAYLTKRDFAQIKETEPHRVYE